MPLFGKPHKSNNAKANKPVIKTTLITQEQILERGWTQEAIDKFIVDSFNNIDKVGNKLWHKTNIEKIEKSVDFIFLNKREEFDKLTETGKKLSESLNIDFKKENNLLSNLEHYIASRPIYHLTKKDFAPDENGSYTLFTDGTFKVVDKQAFASCGGWILNNKNNEVIFEFSQSVELDNNRRKNMPNFELAGIAEGLKIINQLKLKNVQIYTDSFEESRRLYLASKGFKDEYFQQNESLYEPVFNNLKNSNSLISWLPREYNSHADNLSEIQLHKWEKENLGEYKDKDYILEHGYKVDREKAIYLNQNKADFKEKDELNNNLTIIVTYQKKEGQDYMTTLLHDNITHRLKILDSVPKDFSYIDQSLPEEVKRLKKAKPDGIHLATLAKALNNFKDLGDINICVSPLVMAIENKATPIPTDLQEEFFDFHKALNDYPSNITMTHKWKKLDDKIKRYLYGGTEKNETKEENVTKKVKPR